MKASVYISTSLDGFIARENGDLDWLPGNDGGHDAGASNEDYGYQEFMDSVDVLVMGRNSYEKVLSFGGKWPYTKPVVVLSGKPLQIPSNIAAMVTVKSCSPAELVEELAADGVKHLYIDGGKTIQGFLNAGLVQEIIITVIPRLIGRGISLFGPLQQDVHLLHVATQSFANGFVQHRYRMQGERI